MRTKSIGIIRRSLAAIGIGVAVMATVAVPVVTIGASDTPVAVAQATNGATYVWNNSSSTADLTIKGHYGNEDYWTQWVIKPGGSLYGSTYGYNFHYFYLPAGWCSRMTATNFAATYSGSNINPWKPLRTGNNYIYLYRC